MPHCFRIFLTVFLGFIAFKDLGFAQEVAKTASTFDHSHIKAAEALKKVVEEKGSASKVKYHLLKKDMSDLDAYLGQLQSITLEQFNVFTKEQQLAFLINAYNLYTLKLIVQKHPLKSIRNIGGLFFSNAWNSKQEWMTLFKKQVTLDQIEHGMIRGKKEAPFKGHFGRPFIPLIHFALNCASIGCPMLRAKPYQAQTLEKDLIEGAKLFLQDASRNRFDEAKKTIYLSKIFKWYEEDFGGKSGVKNFVKDKITNNSELMKNFEDISIKYLSYDWGLNESPAPVSNK